MMDAESQTPVTQEKSAGGGCVASCYRCFFESSRSSSATYLRISNILNALLLMIAGISSLTSLGNWVTLAISFIFLSFYLTCFVRPPPPDYKRRRARARMCADHPRAKQGCILCCFELRISWIERRAREAFGFLYSYAGRAIFLLFIAGLGFGLISQNASLGYAVGILTALNAVFNMVIIYRHGKLFEDPSAEYDTAESRAAGFLRENPEMARNAVGAGINLARNNPECVFFGHWSTRPTHRANARNKQTNRLARQGMEAGSAYAREHPTEAAQIAVRFFSC